MTDLERREYEGTIIHLEAMTKRVIEIEAALTELVTACETSFLPIGDEDRFPGEKNVCHNQPDNHGLTFGHIRRAQKILEQGK